MEHCSYEIFIEKSLDYYMVYGHVYNCGDVKVMS